jgi:hypothetical protein
MWRGEAVADYQAIMAVSKAVLELLRRNYEPKDFNFTELVFEVFQAKDFSKKTIDSGVSLFMYRIFPNGSHRTPSGRIDVTGRRHRTQLAVDLHFLLTAWGNDASLQHSIAGWMIRTLEDTPILPANLLNTFVADVFRPEETVEIIMGEMDTEVMVRLWDSLLENTFQLSVPYMARNVWIESRHFVKEGGLVQTREFG